MGVGSGEWGGGWGWGEEEEEEDPTAETVTPAQGEHSLNLQYVNDRQMSPSLAVYLF